MEAVNVQVIPNWYFALSAFLLVIIAAAFIAVGCLMVVLVRVIKNIQEPVNGLLNKVNHDLIPKVESLVTKVDGLTDRVSGIAENARVISSTARGTVEKVSGGANLVSNTFATLAEAGVSKLRGAAPYIGIALTVLRMIKEFRGASGAKELPTKAETRRSDEQIYTSPASRIPSDT